MINFDVNRGLENKKTSLFLRIIGLSIILIFFWQIYLGKDIDTPIFKTNMPKKDTSVQERTSVKVETINGDVVFGNKVVNPIKGDTLSEKMK